MTDGTELEIRYKPQGETLARLHRSDKMVQLIKGPLGSGKTNAVIIKLLRLMCEQAADRNKERKSRWVITRNTYPDLTDTTIRDWLDIVPPALGKFSHGHPPEHKLDFRLEDGTRVLSEVVFLALDRPDHVKKLRGMQLTGGWMNEGKEQPKSILDMLTLRVGRYPRKADGGASWYGVIVDFNAPDEDEWIFHLEQEWNAGSMPDYEFFIQPGGVIKQGGAWIVNPKAENLQNLPDGYYQRGMQGKSEDWIKVNLANENGFVVDGKPVHPDYSDNVHCAGEVLRPVPGLVCTVGLDFGLTPAAALCQRQTNGRWIVFDELVTEDTGAERFAEELAVKLAEYPGCTFEFIGDPAGDERSAIREEETVFTVLRVGGINARKAPSNDPTLRRAALTRPLTRLIGGKPGILVGANCKMIRKGLAGAFCYKRVQVTGQERFRDKPDKNRYSHPVEALEYALLGGGENAKVSRTSQVGMQSAVTVKPSWDVFDS